MAQSISCLPHRPESLSSDLQHPYKKVRRERYTFTTTALGERREEWRQQISNQLASSRFNGRVGVKRMRRWIKEDI